MRMLIIPLAMSWFMPILLPAAAENLPGSMPSVTLQPPVGVFADENACSLAFSSDGQTLAVAGYNGTIEIWNWNTCRFQNLFKGAARESPIAISPDGGSIAFVRHSSANSSLWHVGIWSIEGKSEKTHEIKTNDLMQKYYHMGNIYCLAFDPGGELVVTGGRDRTIRSWHARNGEPKGYSEEVLTGSSREARPGSSHDGMVLGVGFAPNGRSAASVSRDQVQLIRTLPRNRWNSTRVTGANQISMAGLAFSADSRFLLLFGGPPAPRSTTGDSRRRAGSRGGRPAAPAVSRSTGGRLLLASATSGRTVATIAMPNEVHCAAFSPDGKLVAAGDSVGDTHLIDVAKRKIVKTLAHTGARAVAFSPDGKAMATAGDGGPAKLWYFDVTARPEKLPNYEAESKIAQSQSILAEAKRLIARKRGRQAIGKIHAILNNYSDTPAAAEVPALLTKIIETYPKSQAAKNARAIQGSLKRKQKQK